jgi:hypothetical protein
MAVQMQVLDEQEQKKINVLNTFRAMLAWPYWNEVFLNCVKESPLSYEAFVRAVQSGDVSRDAFDHALAESRMTKGEFDACLPEFLKFMALYKEFDSIGMLGDGPDQIWHSFLLLDRYGQFCDAYFGFRVDHLPCSLYELYGVQVPTCSCIGKCVPSSCQGNGGGCKPDSHLRRDTDPPELTKQRILAGRKTFVEAYTFVFGSPPDPAIWNQLAN